MLDPLSLLAGAIVAVGLAVLIYTQRDRIRALRDRASQQVRSTRERLSRSAEGRYREAVAEVANTRHLAGMLVPFERVAILPQFYTLPPPFNPQEHDQEGQHNPLNMVPRFPDWPAAIAPYEYPGIPFNHLLRGARRIALLGLPGSGRTATLNLLAITLCRQSEANQPGGLLDQPHLPVLLHLADVDLSVQRWGPEVDVLDPLFTAAGEQIEKAVGALAGMRSTLAEGAAVILIDGWDEVPVMQRRQALTWLQALEEAYPGNYLVVVGPAVGYEPLQNELGLTPVFMMPWGNTQLSEIAELWAAAWPQIAAAQQGQAEPPGAAQIELARLGARGRNPLEAVLQIWMTYTADDPGLGQVGWFDSYLARVVPGLELRPGLERIARHVVEHPEENGIPVATALEYLDAARAAARGRASVSAPDFLGHLIGRVGLLSERLGERLTFNYPQIAAHLAAHAYSTGGFQESLLLRRSPTSRMILPFLAQLTDLTDYVRYRLAQEPTIGREELLDMALWVTDADPRAAWPGEVFRELAKVALDAATYPLLRERAMAALVSTRNRNVSAIFTRALRHGEVHIRMLGALGLGALGDPEQVGTLGSALHDSNAAVETAATLALGAIGTRAALNYLIDVLLTSSEMPRRAVAEMLSTNTAGEGHAILREAMDEEDPLTRRAAVFGLHRIHAPWVTEALDKAHRLDSQWVVRSAAAAILEERRTGAVQPIPTVQPPHETPWLSTWLANREERVERGQRGYEQLARVLAEGEAQYRLAAAEMLGALVHAESIGALYDALSDEHPDIRDAAYRALSQISLAIGHRLPAAA